VSRLDHVEVATVRGTVTISWAARDELVKRLRELEVGSSAVRAFEAVGATRPVVLSEPEGVNAVLAAIESWGREAGGVEELEEDVVGLRELLYAHLGDDRGFHE
jgi:hypothetical protein